MGCFSCVSPLRHNEKDYDEDMTPRSFASSVGNWRRKSSLGSIGSDKKGSPAISRDCDDDTKTNVARSFAFKELVTVTQNFREANLIGEGGFGSVYKGRLDSGLGPVDICKMPYMHREAVKGGGIRETSYVCISSVNSFSVGQIVAVKQLNLEGLQGNQEFIVEVLMLSLLHHPNLVNLIGYCTHGEQRLLVYEFMPKGSLEIHLFDLEPEQKPLSWFTRLKIAVGAARGLEYLHCKANPPVIYRDLKSSNILLDNDFNVKLSDFGLAKLGPVGDKTHVSTRVMGTYGYCAPEYAMSGKLTIKSDIYSFGVVLLELITGRKAIDCTRKPGEQNLVVWSRPYLKDRKKYVRMVDPLLEGRFSVRSLHHAVAVTSMCLQEQASFRPHISDIVLALEYLSSQAESCLKSRSRRSSPPSNM